MEKFTIDDFMDIQEKHEEVRKNDTPYAIPSLDGTMAVVGDSNKTETKDPLTVTVHFRFLKVELPNIPMNAKVVGNSVIISKTFENVVINGRNDTYLMESIMGMYPLIKAFDDVNQYKHEEIQKLNEKYGSNIDLDTYVAENAKLPKQAMDELEEILYQVNFKFIHAFNGIGESAQDAIYTFVARLLKIDKTLEEHMTSASVLNVITLIMKAYPEFFNESETAFTL